MQLGSEVINGNKVRSKTTIIMEANNRRLSVQQQHYIAGQRRASNNYSNGNNSRRASNISFLRPKIEPEEMFKKKSAGASVSSLASETSIPGLSHAAGTRARTAGGGRHAGRGTTFAPGPGPPPRRWD